eukprot:5927085-Amphidinium_carterae.1
MVVTCIHGDDPGKAGYWLDMLAAVEGELAPTTLAAVIRKADSIRGRSPRLVMHEWFVTLAECGPLAERLRYLLKLHILLNGTA